MDETSSDEEKQLYGDSESDEQPKAKKAKKAPKKAKNAPKKAKAPKTAAESEESGEEQPRHARPRRDRKQALIINVDHPKFRTWGASDTQRKKKQGE